jgi:Ca-activated chloride channel homolog
LASSFFQQTLSGRLGNAPAVALSQSPAVETLNVNVDLVNMYLTVCNHKGRPVTGLDRDSFSVFEDGRPQFITHFSRETDVPLTIVLLIDTSGSVREKLRYEQEAASDFFYASLRRGRDKAALISFDHAFQLKQKYTDDPALLSAALRHIIAGGGTRLYDALYFAIQDQLSGQEERKVIVLLTDGDDNASRRSPRDIIDLARRNNVSIYTISMNSLGTKPDDSNRSDDILKLLAAETGGIGYFPTKLGKLPSVFQTIATELRSQYTIGYRSTNQKQDGSFRSVRIEMKNSHYAVRARPGYYAPSQHVSN